MGREDRGVVGQRVGELAGRGVLVTDQRVGVVGAEEVGTAGGAVQQRAAGEHAHRRLARAGALGERVGEVGEGVTGGGERPNAHPLTDLDDVAVADRGALERDLVLGVDVVRRTRRLREREPAGDVVVVDVGLEDVREPHPVGLEHVEHPVDVALGVDHEGDPPVVDEVAAVTQGGGLDHPDGQGGGPRVLDRPAGLDPLQGAADHVDRVEAGRTQDVGHGVAAVAGATDHDDRAVAVHLVEASRELTHRDVDRPRHVAAGELLALADVEGVRTALDHLRRGVDADFTHVLLLLGRRHPPMGSCDKP